MCEFLRFFPSLTPNINSIFLDLRNNCLKKKCEIKKLSSNKCFITRFDKMYGLTQIKTGGPKGRRITNEQEINNCLEGLDFEFVNASYYSTLEKFHLFNKANVFILHEGGGMANMMFFPPNSKIIIIANGGWGKLTNKGSNWNWWEIWNKEHYGHLNHKIYIYKNVSCLSWKGNTDLIARLNDINHFQKFLINII